jgi:hypothetical protein
MLLKTPFSHTFQFLLCQACTKKDVLRQDIRVYHC